ncbi:MAG: metallophosphoesterase [Patescibacteria group bacterium]|nr:metallophosphoesterase [Patescibacteria group bacterium]
MQFSIISDIHIGPLERGYIKGVQRKLSNLSEKLLKEYINKINNDVRPDFVVNMGDVIEDISDKKIDVANYKTGIKILSQLKMPIYHIVGNHDLRTMTEEDIKKILGYKQLYYSFNHKNWSFVILLVKLVGNHTVDITDIKTVIPQEQLKWLEKTLTTASNNTIILLHYSLADQDLKGNFWFEGEPKNALVGNRKEVRKILEASGKVKAVINGHLHWNNKTVHNKIPYFTVNSLIENFNNDGVPSNAYTLVTLNDDNIQVEVKGNDPASCTHSWNSDN